jgi:hypothetical protein
MIGRNCTWLQVICSPEGVSEVHELASNEHSSTLRYRHSPSYAVVTFQKVRQKSEFSHVGTVVSYTRMYGTRDQIEVQTPTHWNLIGRSTTVALSMLSPISILPPLTVSLCFYPRKEKYGTRFKKIFSFFFFGSWFQTFAVFWMLYAFFRVIPRRLNFICRRFGTLVCAIKMEEPECSETSEYKFRRQGLTQKKAYINLFTFWKLT